jgi:hypothetical protein
LKLSCTIGTQKNEDSIKLTAYGIQKVEWEALDSPLDNNPNAGGGKRIFPDWPAPSPTPSPEDKYQRVKVKATTYPTVADRTIYFYNIDVDDPSADIVPVDSEDSSRDNRSSPREGTIEGDQYATTNGSGVAERTFIVTLQPGGNFRIVASPNNRSSSRGQRRVVRSSEVRRV